MELQHARDLAVADSSTSNGVSPPILAWAHKYRGVRTSNDERIFHLNTNHIPSQATVADLELPPALSTSPHASISSALLSAYERDYTHLTVVSDENRALLGYLSIPQLKGLLKQGVVTDDAPVEKAMMKFRRKGKKYTVITTETELEELEAFFNGGPDGKSPQDFAVVTDGGRKFVLGVVTRADLEEFVKRRPG
jgi:CBS domain-containing protein